MWAWFGAVAFYLGPNFILFRKLTWITPADFVPVVTRYCVPAVRAAKEYRRDHGGWPDSKSDLTPYGLKEGGYWGDLSSDEYSFLCWGLYNHTITYNLAGPDEHWEVRGNLTCGRIPAPPVVISPGSRPATQPGR